jgi:hypothetical protein
LFSFIGGIHPDDHRPQWRRSGRETYRMGVLRLARIHSQTGRGASGAPNEIDVGPPIRFTDFMLFSVQTDRAIDFRWWAIGNQDSIGKKSCQ